MRKRIKIYFTDFWPSFDNTDNFLYHALTKRYEVEISESAPDYLFYSVFGKEYLKYDCVRIFYTGENIQPDFGACDYAIGFNYTGFGDRYVRYPHWCLYPNDLNRALNRTPRPANDGHRKKFCNFIYSNGKTQTPRDEFFYKLSAYQKVDSGGRHLNNICEYVSDKIGWCSEYRFSIAFENSSTPGYATEKLLQAFSSNTIPIYFGDPEIARDFNTRAFINCRDYEDFDDVIRRVAELDKDEGEYMAMLKEPAMNEGVFENIENAFVQFLANIFEQDLEQCFRRRKIGTVNKKDKIIVYGAGNSYSELKEELSKRFEITAVTSSNPDERSKFDNYIDNTAIHQMEFDYVLIFSNYDTDIADKLVNERGIPCSKILLKDMALNQNRIFFSLCDENAVMHLLLNVAGMDYEDVSKIRYIELGTKHPIHANYTYPLYLAGAHGVLAEMGHGIENITKIARPRDRIELGKPNGAVHWIFDVFSIDVADAMPVLGQIDYDRERPIIIAVRLGMWGTKGYNGKEIIHFLDGNGYALETDNGGMGVFVDRKYREKGGVIVEKNVTMEVTLSAVVPVYNAGNYLDECLNSIAGQTEPFWEVILVNDGSTDDSKRICEEYCRRYGYFILINQKNEGPSQARNAGIRKAQGDYIVFIDADDIVRGSMVSRLKEMLVRNDYDMVLYDAEVLYEERYGEPQDYFKRSGRFYGKDMRGADYLKESFPADYVVSPCAAAYKRQFIQANRLYFQRGIYFEDNDFCLRAYLSAEKITCMDGALYIRRCHNHSIMADKVTLKKCQDLIKVNLAIWDILDKSGLDSLFQVHFVSYYFINAWNTIRQSACHEEIRDEWSHLLKTFRDKWLEGYLSENIGFDDRVALFIFSDGCRKENLPNQTGEENIRKNLEKELMAKLEKVPLSHKGVKVGIYGTGRHTEKMLQAYEGYIGGIEGDIFFIVTENRQGLDSYRGHPLVTCTDIPKDADFIVLSSLPFQKDMRSQLVKAGIPPKKIIELYPNDAFCDLITLAELLEI